MNIKILWFLSILNIVFYGTHMYVNCESVFYFFQLTIIGQTLVLSTFILSLILNRRNQSFKVRLFLSRMSLITISLEAIVVIGYWGLRIFFTKGIMNEGEERSILIEVLCFWVHGGSFLTMFYFLKADELVTETGKLKKLGQHFFWALPFLFLQYLHWALSGEHVYGFLKYFEWPQLIVFQLSLYFLAVWIDYFLTLRHSYKSSLKKE